MTRAYPVPFASDDEDAESQYLSMRDFLASQGFTPGTERVLRVDYVHKGIRQSAVVGSPASATGDVVMAIYAISKASFAICTTKRGWDRVNLPILTGNAGDDKVVNVEFAASGMGTKFGSFSGNPKTEWLVEARSDDRKMRLLEDFSYVDPNGRIWMAPKDSVVDGASIPRALWTSIGSPYTSDYRRASVVHDVACATSGVPRKDADEMFYFACLAGGCTEMEARLLYAGVRIGAWTLAALPPRTPDQELSMYRARIGDPLAEERLLRDKLQEIADDMRSLPEGASMQELDQVIGQHLTIN